MVFKTIIPIPTTVINCDKEGHCYHQGTGVNSLRCCKCGAYLYPGYYKLGEVYVIWPRF